MGGGPRGGAVPVRRMPVFHPRPYEKEPEMLRVRGIFVLGFVLLVAASLAVLAEAQVGPPRRGEARRPRMRGFSGVQLLRAPAVREALNMTEEQVEKLDAAQEERMEAMREQWGRLRDLPADQRGPEMEKLRQERAKQEAEMLGKILSKKQVTQLDQIRLQVMGFEALGTPDVIDTLGITEEQGKKLSAIRDEMGQERRRLFEQMRDVPREQRGERMRELMEKGREIQKKALEKALKEVLTTAQAEKWKDMVGEPVDLDFGELMRAGMRGGRGPAAGRRPGGPRGPAQGGRPRGGRGSGPAGD